MTTLFVCGDVMLARGIDQILGQPCDPTLHEPHMDDAREYIAIAEDVSGSIPRGVPPREPGERGLPRYRPHRCLHARQQSRARLSWLATTLARNGEALGTSVAIQGQRLLLRW